MSGKSKQVSKKVAVKTVEVEDVKPKVTKSESTKSESTKSQKAVKVPKTPKSKTEKAPKVSKKVEKSEKLEKPEKVPKVKAAKVPKAAKLKKVKKEVTKKRIHKTVSTNIDKSGVGIGPARVRTILMNCSLNMREHNACQNIHDVQSAENAANRTLKALDKETLDVIREGEQFYENINRGEYEKAKVSNMSDAEKTKYKLAKKESRVSVERCGQKFEIRQFNLSFDSKFYDKFEEFKKAKEDKKHHEEKKSSVVTSSSNVELTRAYNLVKKLFTRLSVNTRVILASFLDGVVVQFAYNGIHNCVRSGKNIVQLKHALTQGVDFKQHVKLFNFVRNLDSYTECMKWIDECDAAHAEYKKAKVTDADTKEVDIPFPGPKHSNTFEGYAGEICKSVKRWVADSCDDEQLKARYIGTSVSKGFKRFCSYIVYDTIITIGNSLKLLVEKSDVKTISNSMVTHLLQQLHNLCNIDYEVTAEEMKVKLDQFSKWKTERKVLRDEKSAAAKLGAVEGKKTKVKPVEIVDVEEDEDEEDVEDVEDEEDVEAEESDE
jgi:hypothetical protein